jgi:hypothetical protein
VARFLTRTRPAAKAFIGLGCIREPWEDAETLTRVALEVFEGLPQADRLAQRSESGSVAHAMRRSVKETSLGGEALYLAVSTGNWHTTAGAIYAPQALHNALGNFWYGVPVRCGEERKREGKHALLAEVLRDDRCWEIIVWSSQGWRDSGG